MCLSSKMSLKIWDQTNLYKEAELVQPQSSTTMTALRVALLCLGTTLGSFKGVTGTLQDGASILYLPHGGHRCPDSS